MKLSLAQINSTIGDFAGNCEKIEAFCRKAMEQAGPSRTHLILFPELAICGYPPMDLLDQDAFVEENTRALRSLQRALKFLPQGTGCGLGYVARNPSRNGKTLVNAYGIVSGGLLMFEQYKTLLPTYDVFDEARNFESAQKSQIFRWGGKKIGVAICEDAWRETETPGTRYERDPVRALFNAGVALLLVPSASPYYAGKQAARLALASRLSRRAGIPLAYINAVGANDQIIFDGRSFLYSQGRVQRQGAAFSEDIVVWDTEEEEGVGSREQGTGSGEQGSGKWEIGNGGGEADAGIYPATEKSPGSPQDFRTHRPLSASHFPFPSYKPLPASHFPLPSSENPLPSDELDTIEEALVLGIREYMRKCGFSKCHLGLSGGIDSALVAYLAVKAVGRENVTGFSMPSRFSSDGSRDDAADLAQRLGCRYETLPIEAVFQSFLDTLSAVFAGRPFDIAEENLQARVRGTLLMAYSNKWNSMLLTTGNKSELAMGYCTLYGDTNGALGPIGDLFKTEVFALCRRINERAAWPAAEARPPIPQAILDKPPSAELRPNQKDQDTLPPYEVLDEVLRLYLFDGLSAGEIADRGYDGALARRIVRSAARAEFKRRQAPPILKVSKRAFGMGRRLPIARAVYEAV